MRTEEERRSGRVGLLADEPTFLIPDSSPEARCRALVAADLDGLERSTVTVGRDGLYVAHCVEEIYDDLAGFRVACPCDAGLVITDLYPGVFDGLNNSYALLGNFHHAQPITLRIDGVVMSGIDYDHTSANVVQVWALPGDVGEVGSAHVFAVEQGGRVATFRAIVATAPPRPELDSIEPTTATLPDERLVLRGRHFTEPARVALLQNFTVRHFLATVVDDTEMWADVTGPTAPGVANVRAVVLQPNQSSNWLPVTWVSA